MLIGKSCDIERKERWNSGGLSNHCCTEVLHQRAPHRYHAACRIIQDIHKRTVRFQKLKRNLFLALHGCNVHRQQQQLSKFLMRYQQVPPGRCVFSKPSTKLTLQCNHRSGHLKTEHTGSLFVLRRHLGNWPYGPTVSTRSELLVAHEKLGQLLLLTVYVVPV